MGRKRQASFFDSGGVFIMNDGIDKIWLTGIKDFTVNKNNDVTVDPSPVRRGLNTRQHFLFKFEDGTSKYGKKAYFEHSKDGKYKNFNLSIDSLGMSIMFNPSKYNKLHNAELTDYRGVKKAALGIEKELKDIGVNVSLSGQKIYRVDITKDRETRFRANQYTQVLSMLPASSRMTNRGYSSGYKQSNKSWGTSFYGKTEHLKELYNIDLKKPIMRGELTLIKKVVERETGFSRLAEFTTEDNYNFLIQEVYPKLFKKNIFTIGDRFNKYNGIDTGNITSKIDQYLNNGMSITQAFNTIKNQIALNSILEGYGSAESLLREWTPVFEKHFKSYATAKSRFKKTLNEQIKIMMFTDNIKLSNSETPKSLYEELSNKFLDVA